MGDEEEVTKDCKAVSSSRAGARPHSYFLSRAWFRVQHMGRHWIWSIYFFLITCRHMSLPTLCIPEKTLSLTLWPVTFTGNPFCYLRDAGHLLIVFKLSNLNKEPYLICNSRLFFLSSWMYICQLEFCFYYFNFHYHILFSILLFLFF